VVVLHEVVGDAEIGKHVAAVGLLKPPPVVSMDDRFEDDDAGKTGVEALQRGAPVVRVRSMTARAWRATPRSMLSSVRK